jgi:photosystem II stability/assembly factor-like uncharacterized protein
MKIKINIFLVVSLFFNFYVINLAQNSWNLLTTQGDVLITDAITFGYIYMIDEQNGWACGAKGMTGGIYKTGDGGKTWSEAFVTGGVFDSFSEMFFLEDGTIWAGGSKNTSKKCLLYKSTDNGTSWTAYTLPEDLAVSCLYFADNNRGWAMLNKSGTSRIYYTSDGGENWSVQMNGTTSDGWTIKELFCWHFFDGNNAIAAGNNGITIYTTDGGSTWNYRDSHIVTQLWDIHFIDDANGWISGGAGHLLYTTDKGSSWNNISLGISQDIKGIYFVDSNNGWIVGGRSGINQGIIYSTTDGGQTWNQESISSTRDLSYIWFLNSSSGWVVGNYHTVYHYGSATGVENSTSLPNKFELSRNYPNPFNPSTTINYSLPEAGFVTIKIYDLLGQEITTLVNEERQGGSYSVQFNAKDLPSGIYFYTMQVYTTGRAGNFTETKKLLLLK